MATEAMSVNESVAAWNRLFAISSDRRLCVRVDAITQLRIYLCNGPSALLQFKGKKGIFTYVDDAIQWLKKENRISPNFANRGECGYPPGNQLLEHLSYFQADYQNWQSEQA